MIEKVEADDPGIFFAGLMGFTLVALWAERLGVVLGVVLSMGSICGMGAAAIGAIRGQDIVRWGAIGGGLGLALGALILAVDAIVPG
jgi:hypothetical protein